jgi:hypothetical protein
VIASRSIDASQKVYVPLTPSPTSQRLPKVSFGYPCLSISLSKRSFIAKFIMDPRDPSAASSGTNGSSSYQQHRFDPDVLLGHMTPEERAELFKYEASLRSGGTSIQLSGSGNSLEHPSCTHGQSTASGCDGKSDQSGSDLEAGCMCGGPNCGLPPQTWEEFLERDGEFRNAPFSELPSRACRHLLGYIATQKDDTRWEGALEVDKAYQACLKRHEELEHVMWDLRALWGEDYFYKGAGNETIKDSFSKARAIWKKEVNPKDEKWLEEGDPPGHARITRLGELKISLGTVERSLATEAQNLKALEGLERTG